MHRETPHISFILPVRDQCRELALFLFSLYQHFESRPETFEVIVIDDGSKDQTSYVVEKFATQFKTISLTTFQKPRGLGVAAREGLRESKGALSVLIRTNSSLAVIDKLLLGTTAHDQGITIGRVSFRSSLYPPSLFFLSIWRGCDWICKRFVPGGLSLRFAPMIISQAVAQELARAGRVVHSGYQFELVLLAKQQKKIVREIPLQESFFVSGLPLFYFLTVFKELVRLQFRRS